MGQLQSKNACKRRESPEGGSLGAGIHAVQRESAHPRNKQEACGAELRGDLFLDHDCPLEVILPPERMAECQSHKVSLENEDSTRQNGISDPAMECNLPFMDENHQEWVFTLYDFDNSGRVTKEDMSSLMHTIYEVVEASVKQSALYNSQTLRVKLTVTPLLSSNSRRDRDPGLPHYKRDQLEEHRPSHTRRQGAAPAGGSEKNVYRIDENTERRNHYLDLAGIENYTSRFEADNTFQSLVEEQCQDSMARGAQSAPHRWSQPDRCGLGKSSGRGIPFLRSLRSRSKSVGTGGGTTKANKLHGHHPVSWCSPPLHHHQQQPLHSSQSKRANFRPPDSMSASIAQSGLDWELQPGTGLSSGGFTPVTQRHEHHHLHEHHHHHHHHHHYYSS